MLSDAAIFRVTQAGMQRRQVMARLPACPQQCRDK